MAIDTVGKPLVLPANRLVDLNYQFSIGSNDHLSVGRDVIVGEIYNVMTTLIGDEIGDPLYGSNLPLYVFALFSPAVEQRILVDVSNALKRNVPQVGFDIKNTAVFVSPNNRIVGIVIGVSLDGELFTVDISFGPK
jgi:phage baseplate assembly protein W